MVIFNNFSERFIFMNVILLISLPLLFLIPAIYGFVVKISMYQSNQSKMYRSGRSIMNEDNQNNMHQNE